MNRRQKRKQFKKIYGMNPEQYEAWWAERWPELLHERLREAQRAAGRGITFVRIADVKWALILWWDIGKG